MPSRRLALQEEAASQAYAATRNQIRLRLERAFLNHEASLAKLVSAAARWELARKPSATAPCVTKQG